MPPIGVLMKRGFFNLWEFLSKTDYEQHGIRGWRFVCPSLLGVMNCLREDLGAAITANNWYYGGALHWRGVRTLKCPEYSITSMHAWGRALDFDVKGYTPREVVKFIIQNRDRYPEIRFIEIDINWVHIDVGQREQDDHDLQLWSPERGFVTIERYLAEN